MAKETQLFYIGTSKIKEIRAGGSVTYEWGTYGDWTTFKSPVASSASNVTYNKNTKNAAGSAALGGNGGVTVLGTVIPATAIRTISGVERTCAVRYYKRGYTIYTRTSALKKKKKMKKTVYTAAKPYQYRLQYQDKPVVNADYSSYENGVEYIYFADHYYDEGVSVATAGHIPHPVDVEFSYFDVRRNFDTSAANNTDGRDNQGSYVLSNVRANLLNLTLKWNGLNSEEGAALLETLNPSKDDNGEYDYLIVQYLDPVTNTPTNKTFFASDRNIVKYATGVYKEITVTLTEV